MLETLIFIESPPVRTDEILEEGEYVSLEIANYNCDPGWKPGDKVKIETNVQDKIFNFEAVVKQRRYDVIPLTQQRYALIIIVEAIEKEHIVEMVEALKKLKQDSPSPFPPLNVGY